MPATPRTMTRRNLRLVLLAHPFELALGAVLIINGIRGLLGSFSPAVAELPKPLGFAYLGLSAAGGIGVVVGLLLNDPARHIGLGKGIEQASLYVVASAYATLAVLVLAAAGTAGLGVALIAAVVAIACLLRARAISITAAIILGELTARNTQNTRDEAPNA